MPSQHQQPPMSEIPAQPGFRDVLANLAQLEYVSRIQLSVQELRGTSVWLRQIERNPQIECARSGCLLEARAWFRSLGRLPCWLEVWLPEPRLLAPVAGCRLVWCLIRGDRRARGRGMKC